LRFWACGCPQPLELNPDLCGVCSETIAVKVNATLRAFHMQMSRSKSPPESPNSQSLNLTTSLTTIRLQQCIRVCYDRADRMVLVPGDGTKPVACSTLTERATAGADWMSCDCASFNCLTAWLLCIETSVTQPSSLTRTTADLLH